MKVVFLGKYNQTEILNGPEKVAKRIFHETVKNNSDCLFVEYFFKRERKSNVWLRLFGKEIPEEKVLRLGMVRLFFFLVSYQPDVVHIITVERFILPVFLYKILLKSKIVATIHGIIKHELKTSLQKKSWLDKTKDLVLEYSILKFSDQLVFVSELQISIIKKYCKINTKKIRIIPNGIDEVFSRLPKKENLSGIINIVIRDRSGFEIDNINDLLKILSTCSIPTLNVFIIIDKEVKQNARQSQQNNNDTIKISYVSHMSTEQIIKFLNDKHLLINAARFDTFSLFSVECMAAGIVPIVADTVGMSSYIKNGENGFVFDKSEPESIKTIVEEIGLGKYDFQSLSENTKKIYNELTWSNIAKSYRELYVNG